MTHVVSLTPRLTFEQSSTCFEASQLRSKTCYYFLSVFQKSVNVFTFCILCKLNLAFVKAELPEMDVYL